MKKETHSSVEKSNDSVSSLITNICAECGCKYPGHKINCVTDNERARKAQAAFSAKYLNRRQRNKK